MNTVAQDLAPELEAQTAKLNVLREEVAKVIVGQSYMIDRILLALIADGHILIEGIPGLAKTTAVKAVADAVETGFSRIQFTPDLLPADLIGTEIYRPKTSDFVVKKGPLFANLVLADEISPDTCRLWDIETGKKMDKDRFRQDLGGVMEAYEEVLKRVEATVK